MSKAFCTTALRLIDHARKVETDNILSEIDKLAGNKLADNKLANGKFADDRVTDDEVTNDKVADDKFMNDEITDDEISDSEFTIKEITDDEISDDETSDDEISDEEIIAYILNGGHSLTSLLHKNKSTDPYLSLNVLDLLGSPPSYIAAEDWVRLQSEFKTVLMRFDCPIDSEYRYALDYLCKVYWFSVH